MAKKYTVLQSVSGYVWGGIRLPAVGASVELPDDAAASLTASGHVAPAKAAEKPVEAAAVSVDDAETADAKPAVKRRKG